MSMELLKQNRDVMATYKLGQNVVIHPQPARADNKLYGTIVGFALNSMCEVILEIKVAVREDPDVEPIQRIHPLNCMYVIEVL